MAKILKMLVPATCKTTSDMRRLLEDNTETPRSTILLDDVRGVWITNQRTGEMPTGKVYLTRADFERFIRWYQTGKPVIKRTRGGA